MNTAMLAIIACHVAVQVSATGIKPSMQACLIGIVLDQQMQASASCNAVTVHHYLGCLYMCVFECLPLNKCLQ